MSLYEYHSELKAESKLTSSVGNKKLTVLIKSHSLGTQNWRLQLWKDSLCMQYLLWGSKHREKSGNTFVGPVITQTQKPQQFSQLCST